MPTAEEMERSGFTPEDFAGDPVEIWPENLASFRLFDELGTQWRMGSMGPTGLDHNVMYSAMADMGLSADERQELKLDIRVMENAALTEMRKK